MCCIRWCRTKNTISLRFLSGEADAQELVRPEEYANYKEKSASGRFQLLDLGLASEHDLLTFNENTGTNAKTGQPYVEPYKLKWFRNTKFRQAVSYAIDRETIVKSALGGHGAPNYSFVPIQQTMWYSSTSRSIRSTRTRRAPCWRKSASRIAVTAS